MCLYAIGTKNGVNHVLSFHFGGTSGNGLPPGGQWRRMDVDKVSNARLRAGRWHTGTSRAKPQNRIDDKMDLAV